MFLSVDSVAMPTSRYTVTAGSGICRLRSLFDREGSLPNLSTKILPRSFEATLQQSQTSTRETLAMQGCPWHARRDSNPPTF